MDCRYYDDYFRMVFNPYKDASESIYRFLCGALFDIEFAAFLGADSPGSDVVLIVLPFAIAGYVSVFAFDWIIEHVRGVVKTVFDYYSCGYSAILAYITVFCAV